MSDKKSAKDKSTKKKDSATKDSKKPKDSKAPKQTKKSKDSKGSKKSKAATDSKAPKQAKDSKGSKDSKASKKSKEPMGSKDVKKGSKKGIEAKTSTAPDAAKPSKKTSAGNDSKKASTPKDSKGSSKKTAKKPKIELGRVRDLVDDDGSSATEHRVLVDRLWPRGIKKERLVLDDWDKDIAPSPDLRTAFHQNDLDFDEFRGRYLHELSDSEAPQQLVKAAGKAKTIVLVYAAKNAEHNHAQVLAEHLRKDL